MMGTEWFPETWCFLSELTRLTAREDFITSCRRESFKSHIALIWCVILLDNPELLFRHASLFHRVVLPVRNSLIFIVGMPLCCTVVL
jgi:hypothetical protein